ncbi:hypothetical protein Hypma_014071 [Hypsizygus marmoreus]|uniref:Uncharacterized protein n=1 Tax=Hypsizygus marmoreus TaxID=39966 RepID=A0A369K8P1_HYPMA|nr:hypothetical protein Hypma_014071 [Hypsizygus marmoreus]
MSLQTSAPARKQHRRCPCCVCKPLAITQRPETIRNHVKKHGISKPTTASLPNQDQTHVEERYTASPLVAQFPANHSHEYSPTTSAGYASDGALSDLSLLQETDITAESRSASPSLSSDNNNERVPPATIPYDSDASDNEYDLLNDPLYRSRSDIFDVQDTAGAASGESSDSTPLPPAFSEHPALRNAYVHAFVNAAYKGSTHSQTKDVLTSIHSSITSVLRSNTSPSDLDLHCMARTLRTVEKRLSVDPDDLIIYCILCPQCWKVYKPETLSTLDVHCTTRRCNGLLYSVKRTASGTMKKTPFRTMPVASLRKAIGNMLMRPSKWEEINSWRKDEDFDPSPPVSREEWYEQLDPNVPLKDIKDGWLWRSLKAGFERTWNPDTQTVEDHDIQNLATRFVNLHCGYKSLKNSTYSTGVLWVSIDNLPRSIRFLRENTFLMMVIPGPHEPTTDQLQGLMTVFLEELRELEAGEYFDVFGHEQKELVHVTMPFATNDTPARLAMGGFYSQNSDDFSLEDITGQYAYAPVRIPNQGHYWVTFSLDHTSQEPDVLDEGDDE